MINPAVEDNLTNLSASFQIAQPFKHVVIDDFLDPAFCQNLLDEFPWFKAENALDENQQVGRKSVHESVPQIGPNYQKLDQLVQSEEFLTLVENITGMQGLTYDPHYIGGGTHENLNGQELDPHVDFTHHPISLEHRRLNLIIYLNHEWEQNWGGNIEFHKNPRLKPEEDEIISILPLFNRAVIFETNNHSWHGFPRVQIPESKAGQSRKSFALYYYSKNRPEALEPHSTIYVERHLNEDLKQKLAPELLNEIEAMLNRRDQHLTRLYQNITNQTKEINQLKSQLLRAKVLNTTPKDQQQIIEKQLALLSYDETRLVNRVQEIEQSTSWRITRPLRLLKRWFS